MNGMFNRIFGRSEQTNDKKLSATKGCLNDMPENVLYGEDAGAIPEEDLTNQLEQDIQ